MKLATACLLTACITSAALAQPTITSLGSGAPFGVTNNLSGTNFVSSGAGRWSLSGNALNLYNIPNAMGGGGLMSADGNIVVITVANDTPQVSSNTADNVSPPFSTSPTLVPTPIDANEQVAAIWNATTGTITRMGGLPVVPSLMVYGSGSSGDSYGTFVSPLGISSNGRFVVGMAYISTYTDSSGETIGNMTWQWRPFLWDSQANGGTGEYTVLPTPQRTSFANWRRRTGTAICVSNDGKVIVGGQEHNVSGWPDSADPDIARPAVWRLNEGTGSYDMTYLPMGVDISTGFPWGAGFTGSSFLMNSTGTIIVGPATNDAGEGFTAKWTWNAGTSSWNAPIAIVPQMTTEASWLPGAVTSCGIPPMFNVGGMTEDGNTVVGQATYSTCGSFMSGGFIWHASDNTTKDWYDYLVSLGTVGVTDSYGPIGDDGDPTRGLPSLGFPTAMSADGTAIAGFLGGATRIPGAGPTLIKMNGGSTCVPPVITQNPIDLTFSRCSIGSTLNAIMLSAWAAGTRPVSFQWLKNGSPIADGQTPWGSTVTGANTYFLYITTLSPQDAGNYSCVITGCGGASVTTTAAVVQPDPTIVPPANDVCETATDVGEGDHTFNMCGAYVSSGFSDCIPAGYTETGDVWYRYTPTFTGNARFQTCGSGFDTTLQITNGCGGQILACNDDVGDRGLAGAFCFSDRSLISSYAVTQGVPVYVRVSSISPFTNDQGVLTITQAPAPPANDVCGDATPVTLGTYAFDLAEASDDYTFGTDFCAVPEEFTTATNRDVWFRLSSPCGLGGTYTITTCGSDIYNPTLHVMSACVGSVLACNDDAPFDACTPESYSQARILDLTVSGDVLIRVAASGAWAPFGSTVGQINITGTHNCPLECGTSDFNGDGDFGTDADIEAFFACLAGNCCPTCYPGGSDFNADGDFGTDADIESFFRVLAGGPC